MTNHTYQPYGKSGRFIELQEVSYVTSLKKTKIYELIKSGELKPIKLGRKTVFLESEVVAWVHTKATAR
ncbi:MAG: AlpA family transcriptional regulator [Legionella sp.]|nr:MAG: AlpA family transcriptional regulator [Legionella sp.]